MIMIKQYIFYRSIEFERGATEERNCRQKIVLCYLFAYLRSILSFRQCSPIVQNRFYDQHFTQHCVRVQFNMRCINPWQKNINCCDGQTTPPVHRVQHINFNASMYTAWLINTLAVRGPNTIERQKKWASKVKGDTLCWWKSSKGNERASGSISRRHNGIIYSETERTEGRNYDVTRIITLHHHALTTIVWLQSSFFHIPQDTITTFSSFDWFFLKFILFVRSVSTEVHQYYWKRNQKIMVCVAFKRFHRYPIYRIRRHRWVSTPCQTLLIPCLN